MFLSPDEGANARAEYRLTGQKLISFRDGVLLCQIGAVIHFIDAFGDERETLPARLRTTADNVFTDVVSLELAESKTS
jgi:hypothetical protein